MVFKKLYFLLLLPSFSWSPWSLPPPAVTVWSSGPRNRSRNESGLCSSSRKLLLAQFLSTTTSRTILARERRSQSQESVRFQRGSCSEPLPTTAARMLADCAHLCQMPIQNHGPLGHVVCQKHEHVLPCSGLAVSAAHPSTQLEALIACQWRLCGSQQIPHPRSSDLESTRVLSH